MWSDLLKEYMKDLSSKLPYLGNCMVNHLGIEFLPDDKEGNIRAEMPVDHRTCQPYGVLNGGASLALAESLVGHGSLRYCQEDELAFGIQVSGNHISVAKVGEKVIATGRLIHKGAGTHVWEVDIKAESGRLVSTVRVVNYIKKRKK